MKNIFTLFSILLVSLLSAQGISFDKSQYTDLLAKAKKENKLVFIDAYASWCGPCKMMDRNVFTQKEVGDYYNTNFINAKIDMEKGEGKELAKRFRVFSYPTYLFLNGDGQIVSRKIGYIDANNFIQAGMEAQSTFKDGDNLQAQFNNGEKNPEVLKKIIKTYNQTDYNFAKKASERYFEVKKDAFSSEDINYLIPYIRTKEDKNFKYFTSHKEEIVKILPENDYNLVRQQILVSDVFIRHTNEKTSSIDNEEKTLNELVKILGKEEAENIFMRYKLSLYQNSNIEKFIETALAYYSKQQNYNPMEVSQVSWIISEKSDNKKAIETATEWMEKIVMNNENSDNTFILAKLYHKAGKNKEAKMFAEASINLSNGKDISLAKQLLQQLQ